MSKTFKERMQAKWAKWEKKIGMTLSNKFREEFERDLGWNDSEVGLVDLDGALTDFFQKVKALNYLPPPKTPKCPPNKRYSRPFNKRLHLVDFIIGKQLTLRNYRQRSFTLHKRINWKQACEAWNEAHPYDLMTPNVLKATYYRAIAEEDIQREYFIGKDAEYAARFGKLLSDLVMENRQAFERFGQALERFGQLVITVFEGIGRFALNHKDEIENLLLMADKLNSMTDSEKEEYKKLLEAELKNRKGGLK